MFCYAKGDVESKIYIFPGKGLWSHNIKVVMVIVRYVFGTILLFHLFYNSLTTSFLVLGIIFYLLRSCRKVYMEYGSFRAGMWGVVLQFVSDFAVMGGFIYGIAGGGKLSGERMA